MRNLSTNLNSVEERTLKLLNVYLKSFNRKLGITKKSYNSEIVNKGIKELGIEHQWELRSILRYKDAIQGNLNCWDNYTIEDAEEDLKRCNDKLSKNPIWLAINK